MSALGAAVADYLSIRRAVGFKLATADKWLGDFVSFVEANGGRVTVEIALRWAGESSTSQGGAANRLSAVRLFARYLQAVDPSTEVPAAGLLSHPSRRRVPYLYSPADIGVMMAGARRLQPELWALTAETAIGLLSATGMRIGEVIGLDDGDIDWDDSVIKVRLAKFNQCRLVPVTASTLSALASYAERRRQLTTRPVVAAFLLDEEGKGMKYGRFLKDFHHLAGQAGLPATARIHDLRHSFAVATILDWYRAGLDVHALMPRLSVYMGHVGPKSTYWYLTGSPELMALVADRLEAAVR